MIDLSYPVSYEIGDGTDLNFNTVTDTQTVSGGSVPVNGFMIDAIRVGAIEPVGFTDARSTSDGIDVAEAYASRRTVTISLSVYGITRQDLFQKMQTLTDMMRFMPKRYAPTNGFRKLKFTQLVNNTSVDCYFFARPQKIPNMDALSSMTTGNTARGYSTRVRLEFLLKYPYKYSQTLKTLANVVYNNSVTEVVNNGSAPADATLTFSADTDASTRAADIKVIVTIGDTPITLLITKTIGLDNGVLRSVFVDFSDQIVYEIEKTVSTGVAVSSIAQNLIQIDSGATFGTVEPEADYPNGNDLTIQVLDATTLAAITTGYKVSFSWQEMWY